MSLGGDMEIGLDRDGTRWTLVCFAEDLVEEINYLSALNEEFKKTEKTQAFEISKNSLVREKIKEIELRKNFKELNVDDENLNKLKIEISIS